MSFSGISLPAIKNTPIFAPGKTVTPFIIGKNAPHNEVCPPSVVLDVLGRNHTVQPLACGERGYYCALASLPSQSSAYAGSGRDDIFSGPLYRFFASVVADCRFLFLGFAERIGGAPCGTALSVTTGKRPSFACPSRLCLLTDAIYICMTGRCVMDSPWIIWKHLPFSSFY